MDYIILIHHYYYYSYKFYNSNTYKSLPIHHPFVEYSFTRKESNEEKDRLMKTQIQKKKLIKRKSNGEKRKKSILIKLFTTYLKYEYGLCCYN